MRAGLILVAPVLALAPSVVIAANPTAQSSTQVVDAPLPLQLAQEFYSKEILPAFSPDFSDAFEKGLRASAKGARMERLFPGFTHRFAQEALPVVRAALLTRLPLLQARVANVYKEKLTPSEQQELLDFARSPAGHALRQAVGRSYDVQALTQSVMQDQKVTEQTLEQQRELVGMGIREKIGEADAAEIKRFVETSVGKKAAEIDDGIQPMLREFANEPPPPEVEKRLNTIALSVAREMARKRK
jgi:hypothetical protein